MVRNLTRKLQIYQPLNVVTLKLFSHGTNFIRKICIINIRLPRIHSLCDDNTAFLFKYNKKMYLDDNDARRRRLIDDSQRVVTAFLCVYSTPFHSFMNPNAIYFNSLILYFVKRAASPVLAANRCGRQRQVCSRRIELFLLLTDTIYCYLSIRVIKLLVLFFK